MTLMDEIRAANAANMPTQVRRRILLQATAIILDTIERGDAANPPAPVPHANPEASKIMTEVAGMKTINAVTAHMTSDAVKAALDAMSEGDRGDVRSFAKERLHALGWPRKGEAQHNEPAFSEDDKTKLLQNLNDALGVAMTEADCDDAVEAETTQWVAIPRAVMVEVENMAEERKSVIRAAANAAKGAEEPKTPPKPAWESEQALATRLRTAVRPSALDSVWHDFIAPHEADMPRDMFDRLADIANQRKRLLMSKQKAESNG